LAVIVTVFRGMPQANNPERFWSECYSWITRRWFKLKKAKDDGHEVLPIPKHAKRLTLYTY